jgi:hypothetical protein
MPLLVLEHREIYNRMGMNRMKNIIFVQLLAISLWSCSSGNRPDTSVPSQSASKKNDDAIDQRAVSDPTEINDPSVANPVKNTGNKSAPANDVGINNPDTNQNTGGTTAGSAGVNQPAYNDNNIVSCQVAPNRAGYGDRFNCYDEVCLKLNKDWVANEYDESQWCYVSSVN